MIPIAKEGLREIALATLVLSACAALGVWLFWPIAIPFVIVWIWVLAFFRDPNRQRTHEPGDLCGPADGTITEITELDHHDAIGGPAIRIGMFLSLFNVHINRMPCSGTIRDVIYKPGKFLDARHPESGSLNEANTVIFDPDPPMPGPIEVRQVAGLVARRIICHAKVGESWSIGSRFGLIKFGSRTELVIPRSKDTQVCVKLGDKIRAGLTTMARQPVVIDGLPSACENDKMPTDRHGAEQAAGHVAKP